MSGIQLKPDFNDKEFRRLISSLAAMKSGALQRALKSVGEAIHSATMDSFDREESPGGKKWERSARAVKEGGQTLSDTGRLKASITISVGPGHVEVGTNAIYAAIHQLGGKAGRGHSVELPARPFLPDEKNMSGELRQEMLATLVDNIQRAIA